MRSPVWVCLVVACAGCGSRMPSSETGGQGPGDNLAKVFRAYRQAAVTLRHPPRNVNQLKPYLENKDEAALRSPRDGENYEIVWGVDLMTARPDPKNPLVFAYEKRGKDGSRYVLTLTGPRLMSDAEFRQAQFPAGHRPPAD